MKLKYASIKIDPRIRNFATDKAPGFYHFLESVQITDLVCHADFFSPFFPRLVLVILAEALAAVPWN